jgi:hypothetical protein
MAKSICGVFLDVAIADRQKKAAYHEDGDSAFPHKN